MPPVKRFGTLLNAPSEAFWDVGECGRNWFTDVSEAFCRVSSDTECSQLVIEHLDFGSNLEHSVPAQLSNWHAQGIIRFRGIILWHPLLHGMLLREVNVEGFECFSHVDASASPFSVLMACAHSLRYHKAMCKRCEVATIPQLLNGQKASLVLTLLGKARDSLLTRRCQHTSCYRHLLADAHIVSSSSALASGFKSMWKIQVNASQTSPAALPFDWDWNNRVELAFWGVDIYRSLVGPSGSTQTV